VKLYQLYLQIATGQKCQIKLENVVAVLKSYKNKKIAHGDVKKKKNLKQ